VVEPVLEQPEPAGFAEKGYEVDRRRIMLEEPIRALGVYTVPVRLHPEVEAQVRLWVVKE
jgi:large subunit ribosomal protein L9